MICGDVLLGPYGTVPFTGLVILSLIFSLFIAASVYVLSQIFSSVRLKMTSIETLKAIFSTTLIMITFNLCMNFMCGLTVGDAVDVFAAFSTSQMGFYNPNYPVTDRQSFNQIVFTSVEGANIYKFGITYLNWAKLTVFYELLNVRSEFSSLIKAESDVKWKCNGLNCLVGGSGVSVKYNAGAGLRMVAYQIRLQTLVYGLLYLISFMKFYLLVLGGIIEILLPYAVVMRCLPGLRGYGSALIAVFASLYFVLPFLLVASAFMWKPIVDMVGERITYPRACASSFSVDGQASVVQRTQSAQIDEVNPWLNFGSGRFLFDTMRSFVTSIFMPSLYLFIIAASIKYLGQLIDQDIMVGQIFDVL